MTIDDVWRAWGADLDRVEKHLVDLMTSEAPVTAMVGKHLVGGGGKRLRPLLVVLSGKLFGYKGDDDALLGAIVEAIHSASLLHDDVVDGADVRRNRPTAHSLWGSQITVLVGDFLYSNALRRAVELGSRRVMEILAEATTKMTEGELFQLGKIGDTSLSVDDYSRIIEGKTAALVAGACRLGPVIAGGSPDDVRAMGEFGTTVGTAFQVVDDVLDYQAEPTRLGKTLGTDLREGKLTLPLILLLARAETGDRAVLEAVIEQESVDEADVDRVVELLLRYSCLDDAMAQAARYIEAAKACIAPFPAGNAKEALLSVADYALRRKR